MDARINLAGARAAHEVASWVPPLARFGYAAKGIVYLIIGWIAAKAAFAAGSPEGSTGALREMASNGGKIAIYVIAAGLFAHVVWRFVQAALDPEHPGEQRAGMRAFYAISGLIYGSLALTALKLAQGRDPGDGGNESRVAELMSQPFGRWIVGLIGVGVLVYGIHQLVKAFRGDVAKRLGVHDPDKNRAIVALGRFGTAARGVVLGILGAFFIDAARRFDPKAAGDTQDALLWLGNGWPLAVVAIGLMAYGAFQIAKALYRRIATPSLHA